MSPQGQPYSLADLLTWCKQLHDLFVIAMNPSAVSDTKDDLVLDKRVLVGKIEEFGLQALVSGDRMTLYTCATKRRPSRQTDRIYGIMQIWGFQLGKAAPGTALQAEWTVEELAQQLGQALLEQYPIESQLQVHLVRVLGRQAWRPSRSSAAAPHNLKLSKSGHLEGIIDRASSNTGVRGRLMVPFMHISKARHVRSTACETLGNLWSTPDKGGAQAQYAFAWIIRAVFKNPVLDFGTRCRTHRKKNSCVWLRLSLPSPSSLIGR
jgi:hypothetical protein